MSDNTEIERNVVKELSNKVWIAFKESIVPILLAVITFFLHSTYKHVEEMRDIYFNMKVENIEDHLQLREMRDDILDTLDCHWTVAKGLYYDELHPTTVRSISNKEVLDSLLKETKEPQ